MPRLQYLTFLEAAKTFTTLPMATPLAKELPASASTEHSLRPSHVKHHSLAIISHYSTPQAQLLRSRASPPRRPPPTAKVLPLLPHSHFTSGLPCPGHPNTSSPISLKPSLKKLPCKKQGTPYLTSTVCISF